MTVARIRAELSLGIIRRILLPKCLLDWCHGKLHIDVIKALLHDSALILRFALLNRTQSEPKKVLLSGIHFGHYILLDFYFSIFMLFNRTMSFSIAPFKGAEPPDDTSHINLHIFEHGSTSGKRNCTWTVPDKVRIVFFYDPYKSDTVICTTAGKVTPKADLNRQTRYVLEPGQTYRNMPCFHMTSDPNGGVFAQDGMELVFSEDLRREGLFGGQPAEQILNTLTRKIRAVTDASGKTPLKDVLITYYLYMCGARDNLRGVSRKVLTLGGGKKRKTRRSTRRSTRRTRRKV